MFSNTSWLEELLRSTRERWERWLSQMLMILNRPRMKSQRCQELMRRDLILANGGLCVSLVLPTLVSVFTALCTPLNKSITCSGSLPVSLFTLELLCITSENTMQIRRQENSNRKSLRKPRRELKKPFLMLFKILPTLTLMNKLKKKSLYLKRNKSSSSLVEIHTLWLLRL